jgi:hypothetical protein
VDLPEPSVPSITISLPIFLPPQLLPEANYHKFRQTHHPAQPSGFLDEAVQPLQAQIDHPPGRPLCHPGVAIQTAAKAQIQSCGQFVKMLFDEFFLLQWYAFMGFLQLSNGYVTNDRQLTNDSAVPVRSGRKKLRFVWR